jgi:outer membrane protein assembly factor BamB
MFPFWKNIVTLFAFVAVTNGQTTYLPIADIQAAWTGSAGPVGVGNGVFLSPNGDVAVVVSSDASATAFNPLDGTELWSYDPPSATANSTSGAFFCYSAPTPYLVYSFADGDSRYVVGY